MIDLFCRRRSIRTFTAEPLSEELVEKLLHAAFLAPSSMNKKPVELVLVTNRHTLACLAACKKSGTTPLATAALGIVLTANAARSDVWIEDAAIAATFIQLEAEHLGLGSTWVQFRLRNSEAEPSEDAVRRLLGIPESHGVLAVIAVGHKGEHKEPAEAVLDAARIHYEHF